MVEGATMSKPIVAVCLFGSDLPQWMVDSWLKAWDASGNSNEVVGLSHLAAPPACDWPHPIVNVAHGALPEALGAPGASDAVKAQGFAAVGRCIVMDIDAAVVGSLRELDDLQTPLAMARDKGAILRGWSQVAMEMNAGFSLQNDARIWPWYEKYWNEYLPKYPQRQCYGQFVFGRVLKELGGVELPSKWNQMGIEMHADTRVLHFFGGHKLQMPATINRILETERVPA